LRRETVWLVVRVLVCLGAFVASTHPAYCGGAGCQRMTYDGPLRCDIDVERYWDVGNSSEAPIEYSDSVWNYYHAGDWRCTANDCDCGWHKVPEDFYCEHTFTVNVTIDPGMEYYAMAYWQVNWRSRTLTSTAGSCSDEVVVSGPSPHFTDAWAEYGHLPDEWTIWTCP
jgi:hypothetical protein